MIANAILGVGSGEYGTIFVILAIIFLLGFFLEWIEITMIMLPIVAPIIAGMDLAWLADSGIDLVRHLVRSRVANLLFDASSWFCPFLYKGRLPARD